MLSAVILNVNIVNVVMLSVIMVNVAAPPFFICLNQIQWIIMFFDEIEINHFRSFINVGREARAGSAVVEQSPHHPEVQGLSPASAGDAGTCPKSFLLARDEG